MLLQSGFMKQVGLDRMFVTLHDAIQQISSDLEAHSANKVIIIIVASYIELISVTQ